MSTTTIDITHLRRRYHALLQRHEALALCAEMGVGERAFKLWCKSPPVEGREFRVLLAGHGRHRYRRDTILEACGVLPSQA